MDFIEWCNNNMGFASLLLSALTLFVSALAIIVSLHTAKLPYKKNILISTGSYISSDGIGIHVTATNIGNRKVKIRKMGILIDNIVYVDKNALINGHFDLNQGDETSHYFRLDELKKLTEANKIHSAKRMMAFAEDTEGKKYKKNIGRVDNIINLN
ncbi:MAG: hypothetical protein EOM34_12305 [Clostridia bacterium]|nr:hypothetical protein [Lachnospiraceae bacterium]NCC01436.1 hypothetical protein [Clostridia bacterium]NCD02100.1 hypothetical protein [Clostridia bacterium]